MLEIVLLSALAATTPLTTDAAPRGRARACAWVGGGGFTFLGEPAIRLALDSELAWFGPWFLGARLEAGHRGAEFFGPYQDHTALSVRGGHVVPLGPHSWTTSVSLGPALTQWRSTRTELCLGLFEPCPPPSAASRVQEAVTVAAALETGIVLRWGWLALSGDVGLLFVGPEQVTVNATLGVGFTVP